MTKVFLIEEGKEKGLFEDGKTNLIYLQALKSQISLGW